MKVVVSFPVGIVVPTPCARRPRSLAKALIQISMSGPFSRWWYSRMVPVSESITGHAINSLEVASVIGILLEVCDRWAAA